jgi:hypothetical protein
LRSLALVAVAAVLSVSCGSGTIVNQPATSSARPSTAVAVVTPAGPAQADGLCGTFVEPLAVAVLGGPVAAPSGGDVVPRPNGVYCHYSAVGDANTNVEAQLKTATRAEFEALADTMGAEIPLAGVGEAAFRRDTSSFGGAGAAVVAFANGKLATVTVNRTGADQPLLNAATEAVATAVLLATP